MRFQLYHKNSKGRIIYALPYNLITCEENADIVRKAEKKVYLFEWIYSLDFNLRFGGRKCKPKGFARKLGEGSIEDELCAFSTHKFPIRYCEETVPL